MKIVEDAPRKGVFGNSNPYGIYAHFASYRMIFRTLNKDFLNESVKTFGVLRRAAHPENDTLHDDCIIVVLSNGAWHR